MLHKKTPKLHFFPEQYLNCSRYSLLQYKLVYLAMNRSSKNEKFKEAHYMLYQQWAAPSPACTGEPSDGCPISQPSNMLPSPGSDAVIHFAFQFSAEMKKCIKQADIAR